MSERGSPCPFAVELNRNPSAFLYSVHSVYSVVQTPEMNHRVHRIHRVPERPEEEPQIAQMNTGLNTSACFSAAFIRFVSVSSVVNPVWKA